MQLFVKPDEKTVDRTSGILYDTEAVIILFVYRVVRRVPTPDSRHSSTRHTVQKRALPTRPIQNMNAKHNGKVQTLFGVGRIREGYSYKRGPRHSWTGLAFIDTIKSAIIIFFLYNFYMEPNNMFHNNKLYNVIKLFFSIIIRHVYCIRYSLGFCFWWLFPENDDDAFTVKII